MYDGHLISLVNLFQYRIKLNRVCPKSIRTRFTIRIRQEYTKLFTYTSQSTEIRYSMKTRPSTRIYFMDYRGDDEIEFDRRRVPDSLRHDLEPYSPEEVRTLEQTLDRAKDCLSMIPKNGHARRPSNHVKQKPSWESVVNQKRNILKNVIEKSSATNMAQYAKKQRFLLV